MNRPFMEVHAAFKGNLWLICPINKKRWLALYIPDFKVRAYDCSGKPMKNPSGFAIVKSDEIQKA